jgi:GT2 family glycosyltransferase
VTDIALTICIPTYQRPLLVERAIRSAMASSQAWAGSVELIVSDNSPELTSDTCSAVLSAWPGKWAYFGNLPNIGSVPNLNRCIARASGRYVLILHDDDYLLPTATAAILAATHTAAERDAALLFGVRVVDGDGRLRRHQGFKHERYLSPPDAVTRLLSDSSFVRAPAIVIRRQAFATVGRFDETVGNPTDFDMWLRIFSRFGVRCLPTTISAYSVHEEAATTTMFTAESVRTTLKIFDRAAATGLLAPHVLRTCAADFFHQFILAGAGRRLGAGDCRGAADIMALFQMPEIRALGVSRHWRPVRICMQRLVGLPARLSRAVAGALQYQSWLTRFLRVGRPILSTRPLQEGSGVPIARR